METFGKTHDRYLTPPEPEDCTRCSADGCDGTGFVPGEPRISENICCDCPHHEDPEVLRQIEEEARWDAAREEGYHASTPDSD